MLYRLVRTHLTPYAAPLAVLLVLQLVGTLASLYLPSLNGRIIDEGVAVGDTAFILTAGAVMLAVSLVQVLATIGATRIGAQTSASLGRDVRASVFRRRPGESRFLQVDTFEVASNAWQDFSEDAEGVVYISDFRDGFLITDH